MNSDFDLLDFIARWVWTFFVFLFGLAWTASRERKKHVDERLSTIEKDVVSRFERTKEETSTLTSQLAVQQAVLNAANQIHRETKEELRRMDEKIDRLLEILMNGKVK